MSVDPSIAIDTPNGNPLNLVVAGWRTFIFFPCNKWEALARA